MARKTIFQSLDINPHNTPVSLGTIYWSEEGADRARRLIEAMPEVEERAYNKAAMGFGKMLAKYIKKCIATSTPPPGTSWPPHSKYTTKRWGEHPLLNLSGQLVRSIGVHKRISRNSYFVGPPEREMAINHGMRKGKDGGESTLTLMQLARIHEYGTEFAGRWGDNTIPPRPLWVPAFKAIGGTERIKNYIIYHLRREVKSALNKV